MLAGHRRYFAGLTGFWPQTEGVTSELVVAAGTVLVLSLVCQPIGIELHAPQLGMTCVLDPGTAV